MSSADRRAESDVAQSPVDLHDGPRTLLLVRDVTERNRVERVKSEFVSTVSHELRTPVTSIKGALSLLNHGLSETIDERGTQLLKIAMANASRLTVLVDDILDVERIESGRLVMDMRPIDLRDVVTAAQEHNLTFAADRDVSLTLDQPDEPLPVDGDPSRLIQALTNLISNAAKFSPAGGEVRICAEERDGKARLSVTDEGPGIPLELRPRLFRRFEQAAAASDSRSGTGLGLAITKAIVDQHGGTLDYDSRIGEGTTFRIDLPLEKATL